MKSIVFYYHPRPGIEHPTADVVIKQRRDDAHTVSAWHTMVGLRAEIVRGGVMHALDTAKPRKGEIVLNSAPYRPSR